MYKNEGTARQWQKHRDDLDHQAQQRKGKGTPTHTEKSGKNTQIIPPDSPNRKAKPQNKGMVQI
jgi:hypothetical protein